MRKVKEIKGLRGGVLKYAAREIPQVDTEIAEKGHFWLETSYDCPGQESRRYEMKEIQAMGVSKSMVLYAVVITFTVGCSYQKRIRLSAPGLPERIFIKSQPHEHRKSTVAVFTFEEPQFAPGVGTKAARAVYHELLKKAVFSQVIIESAPPNSSQAQMMELARAKKCDLMITGEVLYYFEGSDFSPSRVDERIRVVQLSTKETLWYAEASDVIAPIIPNDYILLINRGTPAPPASLLLQRNAEKFSRLFGTPVVSRQNMAAGTQRPESN